MRLQTFLRDPRSNRAIRVVRFGAFTLCGLTLVVSGYCQWSFRKGAAEGAAQVVALRRQFEDMAASLPKKREAMEKARTVQTGSPTGSGGADFASSIGRLTTRMKIAQFTYRFDPKAAAPPAAPDPAKSGEAAQPPPAEGKMSEWKMVGLVCDAQGDYRSLTGLLHGLVELPHVVDIGSVEIRRSGNSETGDVKLQMSIRARLYGGKETAQ